MATVIRSFEEVLSEAEGVTVIRDTRNGSLYVDIEGRTVAKYDGTRWHLVGRSAIEPEWHSLASIFQGRV